MKVLVTGGAGYIGSHVVNLLGQAGHDIVVIDNLSTGRKDSVLYGKLIVEDLANHAAMKNLFAQENFEACLHFAGSIVVPESVKKPLPYYENNTSNSLNLIKLCTEHKVNKFIFSSTAAVYGETADGICFEETSVNPVNPYGRSKLMTEWMLEDASNSSDLCYVALRYFNVSGANIDLKVGQCTPNATHLIKIASECASGKRDEMSLFGEDYPTEDGTCIRDYIHVDDLAQAHVDALQYLNESQQSQVLNCGYGKGYSVKQVIAAVKKVTGQEFKVNVTGRREGDAACLISNADKIREVLKWTPKHDHLETIIKTAYEWEKSLVR